MADRPPALGARPELPAHLYEKIARLAYDRFGVDLRKGKYELVNARLSKQLRLQGMDSFQEYFHWVDQDATGEALIGLIDALTTNHTSFWREPAHFEILRRRILPEIASRDRIELWSAASSTGEEVYTILFCLLDALSLSPQSPQTQRKIGVHGTDISTQALAAARQGVYAADRVSTLPADQLRRFFLKGTGAQDGRYMVKPDIRKLATFDRVNLLEPPSNGRRYPVIFCRNVMIYFDKPTQGRVVSELEQRLEPGGYLLIGHAESLTGVNSGLQYVQPAVYRKPLTGESKARR